jgi:hypothetical protein
VNLNPRSRICGSLPKCSLYACLVLCVSTSTALFYIFCCVMSLQRTVY